jgi:hypothetical protein
MKNRRITALFIFLAILIAPICAPFCPSHVCAASPSAQSDHCHSSSVASENAPEFAMVAFHVCGARELPAAALNEAISSREPVTPRYAMYAPVHFVLLRSTLLALSGAQPPHPHVKNCMEPSSLQPSILRI